MFVSYSALEIHCYKDILQCSEYFRKYFAFKSEYLNHNSLVMTVYPFHFKTFVFFQSPYHHLLWSGTYNQANYAPHTPLLYFLFQMVYIQLRFCKYSEGGFPFLTARLSSCPLSIKKCQNRSWSSSRFQVFIRVEDSFPLSSISLVTVPCRLYKSKCNENENNSKSANYYLGPYNFMAMTVLNYQM